MAKRLDQWELLYVMHDYGINPNSREIYLTSESDLAVEALDEMEPGVEYSMVTRFIKNLHWLQQTDAPILIHMKTCGGDMVEGFALYDAIKACPCYVAILSHTHARSMSSIVLQAADYRVLMPHSYFMFHRGNEAYEGDAKTVQSNFLFYRRWDDWMLAVYADSMMERGKYSTLARSQIHEMLKADMDKKADVFLTAKEAVEWGLADAVFDGDWDGLTHEA